MFNNLGWPYFIFRATCVADWALNLGRPTRHGKKGSRDPISQCLPAFVHLGLTGFGHSADTRRE